MLDFPLKNTARRQTPFVKQRGHSVPHKFFGDNISDFAQFD